MSHDKGTNVSRETSRDAGEGEELRESRWNTADAPRSPATPATAPRRFSHHPGGPSPATAHTVAQLLGQRQSTPLSHRRHPASGRTTPRRCPGLTAPRPRGRAAPRRRRPRSARRLASSSPAASQYLAGTPGLAAPRRGTPPASRRLAPPRERAVSRRRRPPPHGRTTLRRRRPCSAIRVTTPRQQRPRRRAHRASRRCSTSRRPPRTRWSQPHLGGLAMVTRSLLGGGPLGLGGLVARRHLLK